jgi:hypothetical protein
VGHLGIFVSGKVAKKEHKQIVSVLKSIERLPPGLYGMEILETEQEDGTRAVEVQFEQKRLEDVVENLNRFKREDEKAFEAVDAISDFNQKAYELFVQPLVQRMSSDVSADWLRNLHPLRAERWSVSDLNPWLSWLAPAAEAVKAQRQPLRPDEPTRKVERMMSELISASLDYYRDIRDATSEALFLQTYGSMYAFYLEEPGKAMKDERPAQKPRDLPVVKEALAAMEVGGYTQALARVAVLLSDRGKPIPLAQVELKKEVLEDYLELLPEVTEDQWRRVRGMQEIMVEYEPERAMSTLPKLLTDAVDRKRLLTLVDKMFGDSRVKQLGSSPQQIAAYNRIRAALGAEPDQSPHLTAVS